MTLEPGDVVSTGTPQKLPDAQEAHRPLAPGDAVTVRISGLGELTTTFVAPRETPHDPRHLPPRRPRRRHHRFEPRARPGRGPRARRGRSRPRADRPRRRLAHRRARARPRAARAHGAARLRHGHARRARRRDRRGRRCPRPCRHPRQQRRHDPSRPRRRARDERLGRGHGGQRRRGVPPVAGRRSPHDRPGLGAHRQRRLDAVVPGRHPRPGYAASKHAVAGLTKALANEWAASGVTVNAIAPGYMATDNTAPIRADADREASILARIPAARWGTRPTCRVPSSSSPPMPPRTSPAR